ncbi:hypothetical protein [Flavobacterium hercynium]|uniref:Uncharacterized protein n=1 Tax=Flavobacterium hercynium TaxID=387094 RepID=A0A226GTX6_9FLAO|nr:hypothetical protein [Flavobacterium hercynium]OXA85489.1 hypothetical protein B0A66_19635 [Flavobacterium hercynium]SMP16395.1 hypothetical protein SAMN06265346_10531 [Flavobacterium hercynium]
MISKNHFNTIHKFKIKNKINFVLQWIIFIAILISSYKLNLTYSPDTSLVNDKLIDVSSIFFGIFLGCLYLFERFKNNDTYQDFLRFCRQLLLLNIIIIAFSFIIILLNDSIPVSKSIKFEKIIYQIRLKSLIFSFYISLFAITLFNIWRFVKIILVILKANKL